MRMSASAIALNLPAAATMRFVGARGLRIASRSGRLWLTEEACADDVFVAPGASYEVRTDGRVVIEAEGDCLLELRPPPGVAQARRVRRVRAGVATGSFARWVPDLGPKPAW